MRNSVDVPAEGGGDGSQDFDPLYDDIVVEEPNNNVASSSNQNNIRVGEPSPNYRLGESFYTSHNYFRKDPNSPYEAECLVCAEKQKEMNLSKRKRVMIQTPQFSPKGMQSHLFAVHKELKVQILKQEEAHDEKKKQNQKEKEEQHLARDDSMKQQKLVTSGEKKPLAVEPRHDPQMQKRFDKAVVQFAAKTGVSFQALSKGNIEILIKPFFPKSTPKIQGRHKSTISRHTSKEVQTIISDFSKSFLEFCFRPKKLGETFTRLFSQPKKTAFPTALPPTCGVTVLLIPLSVSLSISSQMMGTSSSWFLFANILENVNILV